MKTRISLSFLLFLASFAGSVDAAEPLTPHAAEYKVKISMLGGRLNTRLVATETGFEATHTIEPTGFARIVANGSIEEMSGFDSTDSGVLPRRYRSRDTLTRDKTRADVTFDWDNQAIVGTVNDAEYQSVIDAIAHDRVSIQYELMYDLLNGGASGTYMLFDIDEFKKLNVSVIGQQEIKTPAGRFEAIGIRHQAEGSSRVTTMWCVEELDYLPVLIEQHRKGKLRMRATLVDYQPEST